MWLTSDRTKINFDNELNSLEMHAKNITRPRLSMIINNIYIPKLKAKSFASFLYAGETDENYSNYEEFNNKNHLFDDETRPRNEYILGIESSFDESAASLMNSYGEILSEKKYS
jgi:hypothetical protein